MASRPLLPSLTFEGFDSRCLDRKEEPVLLQSLSWRFLNTCSSCSMYLHRDTNRQNKLSPAGIQFGRGFDRSSCHIVEGPAGRPCRHRCRLCKKSMRSLDTLRIGPPRSEKLHSVGLRQLRRLSLLVMWPHRQRPAASNKTLRSEREALAQGGRTLCDAFYTFLRVLIKKHATQRAKGAEC